MLRLYLRARDEDNRKSDRYVLCSTSRIDITDDQQYFCPVSKNVATLLQAISCPRCITDLAKIAQYLHPLLPPLNNQGYNHS